MRSRIVRLAVDQDVAAWQAQPLDGGVTPLSEIAGWGPAEDWSDRADASR